MAPDVNVLVAAFQRDHVHHPVARVWLLAALADCAIGKRLLLLPMVCAGFLRIVTNPRIFSEPASTGVAADFIDALLAVPGCEMLSVGSEWTAFSRLCTAKQLAGNAIQDAWIAMAARHHHAHLVTFDRDFARLLDAHEFTLLAP